VEIRRPNLIARLLLLLKADLSVGPSLSSSVGLPDSVDFLVIVRMFRRGGVGLAFTLGRGAGDRIGSIDPATQVDQPATVRAKRERWQVVELVDLESLRADRTASLNHQVFPLELLDGPDEDDEGVGDEGVVEAGLDFPESLLAPSLFEPAEDSDDDSALAAFLYESLR
jgi:hypothetical protein